MTNAQSGDNWVEYFKNTNRTVFDQVIRQRMLIELVIDNTPESGRVAEVGCGSALLSFILSDYGFSVIAIDLNPDVVEYARGRSYSDDHRLVVRTGDMFDLSEFADGEFDTVCHGGVLEHFADDDIVRALKEQRRIAKTVVFSVPNGRNKMSPRFYGDERFLSNRKWKSLIRRAGFAGCEVYGGETVPMWSYLMPAALFVVPRAGWKRSKPRYHTLASKFMSWRKVVSRTSIFVCRSEAGSSV